MVLLYHERQKWAFCGIHSINNLLQQPRFTKEDFDTICYELAPDTTWFTPNPHKSVLGIGNYDINVLMVLLEQQLNYEVQWHDQRNELTAEILMDYFQYKKDDDNNSKDEGDTTFGILMNLPSTSLLARYITHGRHWLTLLWDSSQQQWYNLDSDLKQPQIIGTFEDCTNQIKEWKSIHNECHIILVKKSKQQEKQEEGGRQGEEEGERG